MKFFLLLSSIFILFLNCFEPSYATVWPIFTAPDKDFLLVNHYIDTNQCASGTAKLVANNTIPVRTLCKTYCPDSWMWITNSDESCHDLSDFELKGYDISYYPDQDSTTLYSVVTALYGSGTREFNLTFITPKEHWYCYEANPELHTVTCGNDV